jgi:competence protein ComEC
MVIDGGGLGGTFDVGERVIAPYLWRRKIRRIDRLILSHAEHDHYGGLAFLARAFAPRELWWNGIAGTGDRLRAFWRDLARHGVQVRSVQRGVRGRVDGVDLDVLAPETGDGGSLNDQSMVLRLRYGPVALLFTGDIEAHGERRLLERSPTELRADVLKVPHHGSRTSSSPGLLTHVDPRLAVVSAGLAKRFRMPHAEVLARYAAHDIALWRTDVHGAVIVTVTGEGTIATRTFRP